MIAHLDYQLAIRARAVTLSVATTGAIAMSATATGFTRSTGSFHTDGFWPGMEFTTSGFTKTANNGTGIITAVSPLSIAVSMFTVSYGAGGARTITRAATVAEASAAGRTLAVGMPSLRAWENVAFSPEPGLPFVEEQYVPGPAEQVTIGPNGDIEVRPMVAFLINLAANTGITANRYADALVQLFAPRTAMPLANGDVLRVRADAGPTPGQLQQNGPGFAVKPVRIFFRLRTANSI